MTIIFEHELKNIHEVLLLGSMFIRKKILWRINFVLIKFSPNVLFFVKLPNECKNPSFLLKVMCMKPGIHLNGMQTTHVEARRGRTYVTFVYCSVFNETSNRPCINLLNANSFWSTDSWWIVFDCLPNVRRTAECCLPRLGNLSTLNNHFVFACRIHIFFVFGCKPGFRLDHAGTVVKFTFMACNYRGLWLCYSNTSFTFLSRILVKTFEELWMRLSTYECRHSHSCAKTTRQWRASSISFVHIFRQTSNHNLYSRTE